MNNIPLLDLNVQYESIKDEISQSIQQVLESQNFIMGDVVKTFEKQINNYIGSSFAYGCASGSDALLLALMAIDIEPGDYVITSPFTFFATAGAISRLGAIPVFIDIEYDSYNIDPKKVRSFLEGKDKLSKRINAPLEKVKAIIPVHLYGQMADMDPIMEIAKEFNLFVIEDAAQSIGSEQNGVPAGTIGDFGCFSFFPSKNLGAYGDAGLITIKDPELAEKVDILRLHGARPKYHHKYVGINSRLDSLQAAILKVKLRHLNEWTSKRVEIANRYNSLFENAGVTTDFTDCDSCSESNCSFPADKIKLPEETTGNSLKNGKHIYHQYTIRTKRRSELSQYLSNKGIGNAIYYPKPLHIQECFSNLGYSSDDCKIADCASKQVLSLPIFPELEEKEISTIVNEVAAFLKK
ncbi:MAG: DegT/DnrJ/EryC1/StrS family aminotransferase [Balneola sp.]